MRAQRLNVLLREFAEGHAKCTFVAMPSLSDLVFIAADGFHPSEAAYRQWAAELVGVMYGEVAEK